MMFRSWFPKERGLFFVLTVSLAVSLAVSLVLAVSLAVSLVFISSGCGRKAPPRPPQEISWVK